MKKILFYFMLFAAIGCQPSAEKAPMSSTTTGSLDRSILPIKEPDVESITELDARNATAPKRFDVTAPENAPNVVVVLIDDIGFGHSSAFGGPIHMPTLEKACSQRTEVQPFSYNFFVFANTYSVIDRI